MVEEGFSLDVFNFDLQRINQDLKVILKDHDIKTHLIGQIVSEYEHMKLHELARVINKLRAICSHDMSVEQEEKRYALALLPELKQKIMGVSVVRNAEEKKLEGELKFKVLELCNELTNLSELFSRQISFFDKYKDDMTLIRQHLDELKVPIMEEKRIINSIKTTLSYLNKKVYRKPLKYMEFEVKIDGVVKRLGLWGEYHIYTKEDSAFAEHLADSYDVLAMEGVKRKGAGAMEKTIAILLLPSYTLFSAMTSRKISNLHIQQIFIRKGKQVIKLEQDMKSRIPFPNNLAFVSIITFAILLLPFEFLTYGIRRIRKKDDPFDRVTGIYPHEDNLLLRGKKFRDRVSDYVFNNDARDKEMSEKIIEVMHLHSNVLAGFGLAHFPGILKHLEERLDMNLVSEFPPLIMMERRMNEPRQGYRQAA
ncbi:hypothetical protein JXA85_01485 [Candidatus Woesearchaeota archaeon]|nr:hypothetical protein [Candidatus Woesearchaeota archaeon]